MLGEITDSPVSSLGQEGQVFLVCMSWIFSAHVALLEFHDDFVFVLTGFVLSPRPTWAMEMPPLWGVGMMSDCCRMKHTKFLAKEVKIKTRRLAKQSSEVSANGDFVAPHVARPPAKKRMFGGNVHENPAGILPLGNLWPSGHVTVCPIFKLERVATLPKSSQSFTLNPLV